jgi:hypothetical protein
MIEYAKVILWGVSFWKALFKKELEKIIEWSSKEEFSELRKYCFDKYSDMHPDVLNEVFATSKVGISETIKNPYANRRNIS